MSKKTIARPEKILELANKFSSTVLSFRDGKDATVFEAILGLRLASENVLHALQAAGTFSSNQISVIRTALQKVSIGQSLTANDTTICLKDDYGT